MKIPVITGLIDRRILVNFAMDLNIASTIVPAPFTPKVVNGKAVAGICLIRLKQVRPKGLPAFTGASSENGAHRIAVEWIENGLIKEGVYILRRDTSSSFNALLGGRVFPGRHHQAEFNVEEEFGNYHVAFKSDDGTMVDVRVRETNVFTSGSLFQSLQAASDFFKRGSTGYSPNGNKYDGLLLNTYNWDIKPLAVSYLSSSYFDNKQIFADGSVLFDNALLMTNVEHEWSSVPDKLVAKYKS